MLFVYLLICLFGCKQNAESDLEAIFVSKMPDVVQFYCGETIDYSGLEIVGVYSDGAVETIKDYTIFPNEGVVIEKDGPISVIVNYNGKNVISK